MGSSYAGAEISVKRGSALRLCLLLFAVVVIQTAASLTGRYPGFEWSTLLLVITFLHILNRFGIVSVPSLFSALLVYPLLVPFVSEHLFNVPLYALRGQIFQTAAVVNKAVFLGALALVSMAVALELLDGVEGDEDGAQRSDRYRIRYSIPAFATLALLVLVSAYLTTPGPTILTVSYETVLGNYYPWANFAGSLFVGSWVVLFLMLRRSGFESTRYRAFLFVTFLGVLWLLLHARRSESMGVLALLGLDIVRNRFSVQDIFQNRWRAAGVALLAMFLFGQVVAGGFRGDGTLSLADYVQGDYAAYPGGAHNIWGTFQATVYLFTNDVPHQWGITFLRYPVQGIPSGVFGLTGITYPPLYSSFLGAQYDSYLGGNYILNPYFADFGDLGIITFGIIVAVLALFVRRELVEKRSDHIIAGVAAVLVVGAFRAFWYTQLAWIDGLQGFIAALLVYNVVANTVANLSSQGDPLESNPSSE